ncbi:MAG: hypothetical protein A2Y62_05155 [Candidatus Fischerbacteria bacterium RBG_13_37_8]|uniref:Antibiotic ABC transporter ATP-binding protein n=1 Tax=Candidatus Fischerbacteria bacterium RBG_13_37_8 TaxID=1817863 RepID=A0A1F5V8H0_9BACT|nr:MAG: hypothetical protein A2Y62_05155 [Candidatus Fischerbacteria bacterium RBG_13_37_8]
METPFLEDLEDYKLKEYDWTILKRLYKYAKPYTRKLVLSLFFLLTASIGELSLPYITKLAIDKYIVTGQFHNFWHIILLYLAALLIIFIASYYQSYTVQLTGQYIMYDMRVNIFRHIQYLPVKFFNRTPVGKIMTRVTNDIEVINELFTAGVLTIIGDVFILAGILIAMFLLNSYLASIVILILPLIFLTSFLFRKNVRETYNRVRFWLSKMNSFLQESISGISIIQIFNAERQNFNRFDELNNEYKQANLDSIFYYAIFYPAIELIAAIATALILFFGGINIIKGIITFGVLVAFLQYSYRFFRPISDLTEKYNIVLSAIVASERIFKILDEPEDKQYFGNELLIKKAPLISFQNVSFAYDEKLVLHDISFEVASNQRVALVGPTGSGKTTIVNLLLKFYDNYSGTISIDGCDIRNLSASSVRKIIGVVFQEPFLFSKSLKENLYLGHTEFQEYPMDKIIHDVIGDKFMKRFKNKLDYKIGERGIELSTGERQLIAFARALSVNPLLLILDEATASIDPETEYWIQKRLDSWLASHTSLIIAHRLSTIKHANQIIMLADGRIIEHGTHEKLMKNKSKYYLFCNHFIQTA